MKRLLARFIWGLVAHRVFSTVAALERSIDARVVKAVRDAKLRGEL